MEGRHYTKTCWNNQEEMKDKLCKYHWHSKKAHKESSNLENKEVSQKLKYVSDRKFSKRKERSYFNSTRGVLYQRCGCRWSTGWPRGRCQTFTLNGSRKHYEIYINCDTHWTPSSLCTQRNIRRHICELYLESMASLHLKFRHGSSLLLENIVWLIPMEDISSAGLQRNVLQSIGFDKIGCNQRT